MFDEEYKNINLQTRRVCFLSSLCLYFSPRSLDFTGKLIEASP